MNSDKPPPAPDPVAVANAQTASNVKTATTQQQLNMVDQKNPYGSQAYTQTGTWPDGTPKYELTSSFSPEQQGLYDQQTEFGKRFNQIGLDQTKRVSDTLSSPFKLGNEATESRLFELGSKRLDPMLERRRAALETQLYNQGVRPGTEAYNEAIGLNTRGANDAYDQLLLTGRQQAGQELLTERNQPINEITALMAGGQVTQPQFGQTPQSSVANTDVAGITQQGYDNSLVGWKADQARNNAMMGGLFGLGGAALGGWGRRGFSTGG